MEKIKNDVEATLSDNDQIEQSISEGYEGNLVAKLELGPQLDHMSLYETREKINRLNSSLSLRGEKKWRLPDLNEWHALINMKPEFIKALWGDIYWTADTEILENDDERRFVINVREGRHGLIEDFEVNGKPYGQVIRKL